MRLRRRADGTQVGAHSTGLSPLPPEKAERSQGLRLCRVRHRTLLFDSIGVSELVMSWIRV